MVNTHCSFIHHHIDASSAGETNLFRQLRAELGAYQPASATDSGIMAYHVPEKCFSTTSLGISTIHAGSQSFKYGLALLIIGDSPSGYLAGFNGVEVSIDGVVGFAVNMFVFG